MLVPIAYRASSYITGPFYLPNMTVQYVNVPQFSGPMSRPYHTLNFNFITIAMNLFQLL